MKLFKCFLKGTNFCFAVISLSGCASLLASVQNPKPTPLQIVSGQTKVAEEKKADATKIFDSYCSGGKQIKKLSLNVEYVSPKSPAGWPVNVAGGFVKKLNQEQQCLSNTILYGLSRLPVCSSGEELRGKSVCIKNDEDLWFLKSSLSSSEIEKKVKDLSPSNEYSAHTAVIVKDSVGKLAWFNYFEVGSNAPDLTSRKSSDLLGDDVGSVYLEDLFNLFNEFTILEPVEFQKTTYTDEVEKSNENSSCNLAREYEAEAITIFKNGQYETVQAFGIDESGNVDAAAAINQKDKIWRRYVSRFSQVKESSSASSPQINKIQVSLDLNAFCRYGRSINDLSSK